MLELLLKSLEEFLTSAGFESKDGDKNAAAKDKLGRALRQYVQEEILSVVNIRRTESSVTRLRLAEEINGSVKGTAVGIRAMTALHKAPPPLMDEEFGSLNSTKIWMKAYREWYKKERSSGMEIG